MRAIQSLMAREYEREHEHELEAEYLHPTDAKVLSIHSEDDGLAVLIAVPCPECGDTLELFAPVSKVEESELELPLEDPEDPYD